MSEAIQKDATAGIIGTGNIARVMGDSLCEAGIKITTLYSRNPAKARGLAKRWKCKVQSSGKRIFSDDILFFCVPDDIIPVMASGEIPPETLCIHTSGTTPVSVFNQKNAAVIWPLQTFSGGHDSDALLKDAPLLIEGSNRHTLSFVRKLSRQLSDMVMVSRSEERATLHLAAVYACNFTNHMYAIAEGICRDQKTDFSVLTPLIIKTALRTLYISPGDAQTGPAFRRDKNTIKRHLDALSEHPEIKNVYKSVTNSIFALYK
jgi:predicted short-subunit dehydrogenase-like oxidoreductase (DUF2520 family)